jgi:hypothetical protein
MVKTWLLLLTALLIPSCYRSTGAIVADSNEAIVSSRTHAQNGLQRIKADWDQALEAASRSSKRKLVYPSCNAKIPDGNMCGLISTKYVNTSFQERFQKERCSDGASANGCLGRYQAAFVVDLRKRYGPSAVNTGLNGGSFLDMELSVLKEYNDQVLQDYKITTNEINTEYRLKLENVTAQFRTELNSIEAERDAELDSSENNRRVWLAIANGLQAGGQALSSGQATPSVQTTQSTCTSDFSCAYGQICLKPYGRMSGTCARVVDEYGTPTYQGPNSDSYQPGNGECLSTGCPIGFRCVDGNCIKY